MVGIPDLITHANFGNNQLMDLAVMGIKFWPSPLILMAILTLFFH